MERGVHLQKPLSILLSALASVKWLYIGTFSTKYTRQDAYYRTDVNVRSFVLKHLTAATRASGVSDCDVKAGETSGESHGGCRWFGDGVLFCQSDNQSYI